MPSAERTATAPPEPRTAGQEPSISLRCPNPKCGRQYTVPARFAGVRARCAGCGTLTSVPKPAPPAAAAPPEPATAVQARAGIPEVRIGCIGRGHAGKSALFHALSESLVGDILPSGLHLDAGDPREVARMIREAEGTQRLLEQSGLPPTLATPQTRYCLYEGDRPLVGCRLREVIGQILTQTLPDSEAELQARYDEYLASLVDANVLWTVVPCPPPDPSPRDRRRYANDLRITLAYLREALKLRSVPEPAAVALVLTKTDSLFESRAQARAALTDDLVRRALSPLVGLLETSNRVSDAAVFPVTAFGFGRAVLRADGGERAGVESGLADDPFGDEPIWLLREGETPRPDNLDTLFLWSLLLGLLNEEGADKDGRPEIKAISRMWRDDLEGGDPWLVPIKGGIALADMGSSAAREERAGGSTTPRGKNRGK